MSRPTDVDWPRAVIAAVLLCGSCAVMVTAWYLHLRMKQWSLIQAVLFSWLIAGAEYCLQVPANRLGSQAGLSGAQLRGLAELAILIAFLIFQVRVLAQPLLWNHLVGFATVFVGVLIVLGGPFVGEVALSSPGGEERFWLNAVDEAYPVANSSLELDEQQAQQPLGSTAASPPPSPPWTTVPDEQAPPPTLPWPPAPHRSIASSSRPPPAVSGMTSTSASSSAAVPAETPARLSWLAEASRRPHEQAWLELEAGQKRGHWVWWAFPTLATRGGDGNSAWQRADLASVDEAAAYCSHAELRRGLLRTLRTARAAFARLEARGEDRAPWRVLDSGFYGRAPEGEWLGGPVDSFKAWCSATLVAGLAQRSADAELHEAALAVLQSFHGDLIYVAGGPGTAGYLEGPVHVLGGLVSRRNVLGSGGDALTLGMLGATEETLRRRVPMSQSGGR